MTSWYARRGNTNQRWFTKAPKDHPLFANPHPETELHIVLQSRDSSLVTFSVNSCRKLAIDSIHQAKGQIVVALGGASQVAEGLNVAIGRDGWGSSGRGASSGASGLAAGGRGLWRSGVRRAEPSQVPQVQELADDLSKEKSSLISS